MTTIGVSPDLGSWSNGERCSNMSNTLHKLTDEAELDALIDKTLSEAGVDLEELRRQALDGRFSSEKLRRTWFVVNGLGRG